MVNLLTGQKGSGKTQQMIEAANLKAKECDGNVVFIKNSHNDTYSLSFDIRAICMTDYPSIRNIDEYTGFLYGMLSGNSDIQVIFIDGILKHADLTMEALPAFLAKLNKITAECNIDFYVSVSADKADVEGIADINIIE